MKFQDDISNMNTYTHTHTDKPKPICPPLFQSWGHKKNQRTNGPVNAHLISWPSKAQNIQNLENIL